MHLKKPLIRFYENSRYNDEPQLFQYTAISEGNVWGGGISFDKKKAQNKAIGESIERYCLEKCDKRSIIYSSQKNLKCDFLDLNSITSITQEQKKDKKFSRFVFTKDSKFNWVVGKSLFGSKRVLIPAQLIYVPYLYKKGEPILRLPISTGAALGTDIYSALARGIFEVIERDSFMIFYLNKLTAPEVDLEMSSLKLRRIRQYFCRYRLDLRLFDITSDLKVPVFAAFLIDHTGVGPCVSVGLKSGFNKEEVVIGAIEEAQHTRGWMRDEKSSVSKKMYQQILSRVRSISTVRERGLFWFTGKYISKLDFWLDSTSRGKVTIHKDASLISDGKVDFLKVQKILQNKKLNTYYVDVVTHHVAMLGLYVVKVIIPELQPLYLDEEFPYLGGKRLDEVPRKLGYMTQRRGLRLNDFPHPFL